MKDAIYDIITSQSGIECQYAFESDAIPQEPFFSLNFNSFGKIGRDVVVISDVTDTFTMYGNREFILEIRGFGSGIIEKTTILQTSFDRPDVHDLFRSGGVIPYDIDQVIQNVSGVDQSQQEERSLWEVMMRTDSVITDIPTGIIEKVTIASKYKQSGKPDIDSTIEIDSTI